MRRADESNIQRTLQSLIKTQFYHLMDVSVLDASPPKDFKAALVFWNLERFSCKMENSHKSKNLIFMGNPHDEPSISNLYGDHSTHALTFRTA